VSRDLILLKELLGDLKKVSAGHSEGVRVKVK